MDLCLPIRSHTVQCAKKAYDEDNINYEVAQQFDNRTFPDVIVSDLTYVWTGVK